MYRRTGDGGKVTIRSSGGRYGASVRVHIVCRAFLGIAVVIPAAHRRPRRRVSGDPGRRRCARKGCTPGWSSIARLDSGGIDRAPGRCDVRPRPYSGERLPRLERVSTSARPLSRYLVRSSSLPGGVVS